MPSSPRSTRREFCVHTSCAAASQALLGPMFAACNSPTAPTLVDNPIPSASATIVDGAMLLTIDSTSPLATVGSAVLIENGLGKFLVARTGQKRSRR